MFESPVLSSYLLFFVSCCFPPGVPLRKRKVARVNMYQITGIYAICGIAAIGKLQILDGNLFEVLTNGPVTRADDTKKPQAAAYLASTSAP